MKVSAQELAVPFRHLKKYNKQLDHLVDNANNYEDLVVKVDDFLTKVGHQAHYTTWLITDKFYDRDTSNSSPGKIAWKAL